MNVTEYVAGKAVHVSAAVQRSAVSWRICKKAVGGDIETLSVQ